jgi:hypothetical protein
MNTGAEQQHPPTAGHAGEAAAGHELSDARVRPLVWSGLALAILMLLAFAVIAILLFGVGQAPADTSNSVPEGAAVEQQLPPAPRLEQNPNVDGNRIITQQTERLESYGWVNERSGTAHIPIERAMELLLEQGDSASE